MAWRGLVWLNVRVRWRGVGFNIHMSSAYPGPHFAELRMTALSPF
jgi:hypothetical protein